MSELSDALSDIDPTPQVFLQVAQLYNEKVSDLLEGGNASL